MIRHFHEAMHCPLNTQDTKALWVPHRLAAWYLIATGWPQGPAENPFIAYLFKVSRRDRWIHHPVMGSREGTGPITGRSRCFHLALPQAFGRRSASEAERGICCQLIKGSDEELQKLSEQTPSDYALFGRGTEVVRRAMAAQEPEEEMRAHLKKT